MGRKLTNKEMTQAIIDLNGKVEFLCSRTQSVLSNFIEFLDKDEDFKEYLDGKYVTKEEPKEKPNSNESG